MKVPVANKFYQILKIKSPRHIYIYSVLIGIFAGLIAVLFSMALSTAEYLSFHILAGIDVQHPPGEIQPLLDGHTKGAGLFLPSRWVLFFLPILGGLMVGFILQFLYSEASGAGTDSMIQAFHHRNGKIPGRGAFFKALGTIFTLATGGSGGREGPTAYIGASLGSRLAQILGAGARARRTLLLAGAAGGLGAIFRAPLGGAITAVEILYREDIESDSLVSCLISSVSAYLTFTAIVGPGSLFEVGDVGLKDYRELPIYVCLGLVCYGIGFIYVKILHATEKLVKSIKIPILFKPALGGLLIGSIALFIPEVIGSGMGYLHETINGRSPTYSILSQSDSLLSLAGFFLILAFFKILSTSITIGSGGSGGLFAPSLFIGAMLGGSVASFSQWMFTDLPLSLSSFMLVGMGAFFSGVARTPFAAMIMISDIIGSYALLPPLMMVTMITFTLSSRWSLYKGQVNNRFKSPAHLWDMSLDILEQIKIGEQFNTFRNKAIISTQSSLQEIEKKSRNIQASDLVVVNESNGSYRGIISLKKTSIRESIQQNNNKPKIAADIAEELGTVKLGDSLADALQNIIQNDVDKVPVIKRQSKYVLGYIYYHDIFTAYYKGTKKSLPDKQETIR